jgi:ketosteroid isomerase-like protein
MTPAETRKLGVVGGRVARARGAENGAPPRGVLQLSQGVPVWRVNMSDRGDFLEWVRTRLYDAELALHNGDAAPRLAIWSTKEPVSVLGAWRSATNYPEANELFNALEETFSDCTSYSFELIAADVVGDMAYTVGNEHTHASVNGGSRKYALRATQVYRREDGEWKVAHRHGDTLSSEPG